MADLEGKLMNEIKKENTVLIIGSGGREDTIAQKLSQSPYVKKIFVAPGNPGIGEFLSEENRLKIEICSHLKEIDELLNFAISHQIDLTIVGSEEFLAKGIVNLFQESGLSILGPTKEAAQIESSKLFAKKLMEKYNIPTAKYQVINSAIEALNVISKENFLNPIVLKASPLAKGKGVFICHNVMEAHEALRFLNKNNLYPIIIEEKLTGKELSHFALCHHEKFLVIGHACDYKRLHNQNKGPNTGGMGSYAPCDWIKEEDEAKIEEAIVGKILQALKDEGIPFKGILFTGLMLTKEGPKVIEFNARFGDPETQALLPLVEEDLFPLFYEAAGLGTPKGLFEKKKVKLKNKHAVHIVLSSKSYPYSSSPSAPLNLAPLIKLRKNRYLENSHLMFSGVKRDKEGEWQSSGGRIMGVTATSEGRLLARMHAYHLIKEMPLSEFHLREDIGL